MNRRIIWMVHIASITMGATAAYMIPWPYWGAVVIAWILGFVQSWIIGRIHMDEIISVIDSIMANMAELHKEQEQLRVGRSNKRS